MVDRPPPNSEAWPKATEDDYTISRPHAHYDTCVYQSGGEQTYTHPGHAPTLSKPDPERIGPDLEEAIGLLADIYSGGYDAKMITKVAIFLAVMNVEFVAEGGTIDAEEG